MNNEIRENDRTVENNTITFRVSDNLPWVIKIENDGTIRLNREAYPHALPDDFAELFFSALERTLGSHFKKQVERRVEEITAWAAKRDGGRE